MDTAVVPAGLGGRGLGYGPPSRSPVGGAIRPDAVLPDGQPMIDLLMGAVEEFQPKYPSWLYKTDKESGERVLSPPPTPKKDQFTNWIQADTLRYADLLSRFYDDLMMYRRMGWGVSSQFAPDIDSPYVSDEAAIQINKVAAMIAGTPYTINYPHRSAKERSQAQAMEAFDLWFLEQWSSIHRLENGSDLWWDLIWSALIYGRQAVQCVCDLDDGGFPFYPKVHDPATVFPLWGKPKQGLIRVTHQKVATLGEILEEFDPHDDQGLYKKLSAKKREGGSRHDLDHDEERTYAEVWTAWSKYTEVDGIQLELVDHEYGETCWVYNMATGEMGSAVTPVNGRRTGLTRRQIEAGWGGDSTRASRRDHVEKGVSFLHAIKNALRNRERLLSMHMTAAEQGINPSIFFENPYTTSPDPFDFGPGGRNELKPGQRATPVINSPRPLDSQPLLAATSNEIAKGLLPDVIFGQVDASNVSGFASDSLMNAARDVIQPYVTLQSNTIVDVLMLKSRLFYNFGHLAEGLEGGELRIPRQRSGTLGAGSQKVVPPPWTRPIIEKMLQFTLQPQQPQTPPPNLPGGGGMIGSDVAGAPPSAGMAGGMLGMPGFVDPSWLMGGGVPDEDPPEFIISPETIDMISSRPKFVLNMIGLQNRTVLANYLDLLVSRNLMAPETAMEQIPEIQDIDMELRKILASQARTNPDSLKLIEYPRALWESGDTGNFFLYYATILMPAVTAAMMQQQAAMAAQAPPTPTGPPPGEARAPGPSMVQGDSAAQLGRGPGAEGRPVGTPR